MLTGVAPQVAHGKATLDGALDDLEVVAEIEPVRAGTYRLHLLPPGTCGLGALDDPSVPWFDEDATVRPTWTVLPEEAGDLGPVLSGQGRVEVPGTWEHAPAASLAGHRVLVTRDEPKGALPVTCGVVQVTATDGRARLLADRRLQR